MIGTSVKKDLIYNNLNINLKKNSIMEKKNQHRLFYMNSKLFDYKRSVYINKICLQFFQSNKTIIASRIINLTQEITIDARFNVLNLNELHLQ